MALQYFTTNHMSRKLVSMGCISFMVLLFVVTITPAKVWDVYTDTNMTEDYTGVVVIHNSNINFYMHGYTITVPNMSDDGIFIYNVSNVKIYGSDYMGDNPGPDNMGKIEGGNIGVHIVGGDWNYACQVYSTNANFGFVVCNSPTTQLLNLYSNESVYDGYWVTSNYNQICNNLMAFNCDRFGFLFQDCEIPSFQKNCRAYYTYVGMYLQNCEQPSIMCSEFYYNDYGLLLENTDDGYYDQIEVDCNFQIGSVVTESSTGNNFYDCEGMYNMGSCDLYDPNYQTENTYDEECNFLRINQ